MAHRIKSALVTAGACALVLGGAGIAGADSGAGGAALDSPGVVSGNNIQIPIQIPVNLCGNTVSVIGLFNPAVGDPC
ncbi:chaplin [Streptomyces sp. Isolate_219]|uniref:chaplin n=1 Tax=Streptomyces sp. Isolate_219 TaxID=2950110 RepID=UPI0021C6BF72|nr:chaplin [Streptomyces sp. Isolate_219]MCR8575667.1 chaplin [Streptomyces sp. Isolate_219]